MKKSFAFLASLVLSAAACAQTAAISTSQTSAFAGNGGGLSISGAMNHQSATTASTATGGSTSALFGTVKGASVGISGQAATSGISAAGNLSIGNASGAANASGVSTSSVAATREARTTASAPQATVTGNAETITGTAAASGTNGLAISSGASIAHFEASATATQIKLGPLQHTDVQSAATSAGLTLPGVSITVGTGTVQLQTEAAANAFGQAKVGTVVSN